MDNNKCNSAQRSLIPIQTDLVHKIVDLQEIWKSLYNTEINFYDLVDKLIVTGLEFYPQPELQNKYFKLFINHCNCNCYSECHFCNKSLEFDSGIMVLQADVCGKFVDVCENCRKKCDPISFARLEYLECVYKDSADFMEKTYDYESVEDACLSDIVDNYVKNLSEVEKQKMATFLDYNGAAIVYYHSDFIRRHKCSCCFNYCDFSGVGWKSVFINDGFADPLCLDCLKIKNEELGRTMRCIFHDVGTGLVKLDDYEYFARKYDLG